MRLFIDSGAFIARHSKNDTNHDKAITLFRQILEGKLPVTRMYTSDFVVGEAVTVSMVRASHNHAIALGDAILNSKSIELLRVDEETFKEAWKIFKKYDQGFSFTDCTSFALMMKNNINHVFSFDKHFDVLGFRRMI